jgi:hypothetical protein
VVRNNWIGSVELTSQRSSVTGGGPGGFARIVLWSLTDLVALAVLAIRRGASGAQESPDAVQAGEIARRVGAKAVVPFHFSPRYEECSAALIAEVQAAWSGAPALTRGSL